MCETLQLVSEWSARTMNKMETESVKSGHSEHSARSRRSRSHGNHANHAGIGHNSIGNHTGGLYHSKSNHSNMSGSHKARSHNNHRSTNHVNKSFESSNHNSSHNYSNHEIPNHNSNHNHVNSNHRVPNNVYHNAKPTIAESRNEVIEVQILPQDDNWGDNTTCITGNTSDHSDTMEDIAKFASGYDSDSLGYLFNCHRYFGQFLAAILSLVAFVSPIIMIIIPRLEILEWEQEKLSCGPECDGLLISFAFKLLILAVGTWAVFGRSPKATMPRIFIFRAVVSSLVFVFIFSYWLFYIVRILERSEEAKDVTYHSVVLFACSFVDALLFIHYLAIILIELRQLQPQYIVKVVRSPDGESRTYAIGQLSIQRASVWLLEKYYQDFSIYNPYLDRIPTRTRKSGFKFYDVDGASSEGGGGGGGPANHVGSLGGRGHGGGSNLRRRDSSHHNERFYEEYEYDRRVKKRRARLITATEDAFTHIKRLHEEPGPAIPMDPYEAAQAIFPSISRPLQKYLRVTRQQPRHTMESVLHHLSICLSHDMSPKSFLEKYLVCSPVLQNDREASKDIQTWALVCDVLLSRPIEEGLVFQLRQNEVSLLCTIKKIPHFNVTEEIIDQKRNKFVLRLNSETSV